MDKPSPENPISENQLQSSTYEFFSRKGFKVLFTVHTDTEHVHVHFLISNCNVNVGKSFCRNQRDMVEQVAKERYLYLALCPAAVIPILLENESPSTEDFSRNTYLMERLGSQNLCCHFQVQHKAPLCAEADKILRNLENNLVDAEKEIKQLDIWDKKILEQLPTERMKRILKELLLSDF